MSNKKQVPPSKHTPLKPNRLPKKDRPNDVPQFPHKPIPLSIISTSDKHHLGGDLQMNVSLMRDNFLYIGDLMLLRTLGDKNKVCVGRAWPSPHVLGDQVNVSSLIRETCCLEVGEKVVIQKVVEVPSTAVKIRFIPLQKEESKDVKMTEMFLMAKLVGSFVIEGMIVAVTIYNQVHKFRIVSVELKEVGGGSGSSHVASPPVSPIRSPPTSPSGVDSETEISEPSLKICKIATSTIFIVEEDKKEVKEEEKKEAPPKIGGLASELSIIQTMIALPLKMPSVFEHFGIEPPKGVLLYGPPGTGKTLIARVLANVLDVKFFVINGPEIVSKYFGESEEKLRDLFLQASLSSPSLIFIDELDSLAPKRDEELNSSSKRIVGTLLTLMDGIKKDQRVIVLAATNRPNSIDSALRRPGRFDREIEIGIPSVPDRHSILKLYLSTMKHNLSDSDIHLLAQSTHGYVGADLHQLCKQAALSSLHRHLPQFKEMHDLDHLLENLKQMELKLMNSEVLVEKNDFSRAISEIRPSAMREILVELPKVEWKEIGGYEFVKQKLRESVEWPLKYPQKFEQFGIRPPRGILLYGPPGCSKTLMAKALATESKLNFIPVKGPELFSKYVGDSERAVREVFKRARMASPSIVFFDEIDAIAVARGTSGDGNTVGDRVLSQLLNELDGITPLNDVLLLAATNRPDIIDKALMRPGRIDNILYIPPPDQQARHKILQIHTSKMKLTDDVKVEDLVGKTEKYSGAEIAQLCREAALTALRRDLNADAVASADFEEALKIVLPRTTTEQLDFYTQFAKSVTL